MPIVHHAVDVAATPAECWRLFADLTSWPRWFPFLRAVSGELKLGARLTLSVGAGPASMPIHCTVQELLPAERVRWIGGKLGMRGDHSFSFSTHAPGLTRVTSREELSGVGMRLLPSPLLARFDDEVHQSLARFKTLVEANPA